MARVTKLREAGEPAAEPSERISQRKRPDPGRFVLQVDRQAKSSYTTAELAVAAGTVIKVGYPLVQVSVYDSVECLSTPVELPASSG